METQTQPRAGTRTDAQSWTNARSRTRTRPEPGRDPEWAGAREPGVPELDTQGELLARIAAQLAAPRRGRA